MIADQELLELLSCPLLNLEEIGESLAGVAVTFRANMNGATHDPACRHVGSKASASQTLTIAAFREVGGTVRYLCRACGGGVLASLPAQQRAKAETLVPLFRSRLDREREQAEERKRAQELRRRADALDERARRVVSGRDYGLDRERQAVAGYPAESLSAEVHCPDCGQRATIGFEPRALRVWFACPADSGHGFLSLEDSDQEPLALWRGQGLGYVAISIVAPVLAGDDDAWLLIYGTRADDYRATVQALATFDRRQPEPMRLTPDVRCGECNGALVAFAAEDFGDERTRASYACDVRHQDGKYRHHEKAWVDTAIDRKLRRIMRDHPALATATELEPDPATIAGYSSYLNAKIATYDAHIGAATADRRLSKQRKELAAVLAQVTAIREQGALAVAGLTTALWYGEVEFTDLARSLLTTRIVVSNEKVEVTTRFDAGTPLHRVVRAREIREELADIERRREQLTAELAELDSVEEP